MASRRLIAALAIAGTLLASVPVHAAAPVAAPAASPAQVRACGERAAAQAATAEVEREVRGRGMLGGCIADSSGIAHLFVEWESVASGEHGRICIDPPVRTGQWRCTWDTTQLAPGSYRVVLTAIDPAGNRGASRQAYRVLAASPPPASTPGAEPAPVPAPATAPATAPAPAAEPSPDAPAGHTPEPAPEAKLFTPVPPVDPVPPDEPAEEVAPPAPRPIVELVRRHVDECDRLALPDFQLADQALTVAVLDCMQPAFEAIDASEVTLDEIPVPPAIVLDLESVVQLEHARELLPTSVGGVELRLRYQQVELTEDDPDAAP